MTLVFLQFHALQPLDKSAIAFSLVSSLLLFLFRQPASHSLSNGSIARFYFSQMPPTLLHLPSNFIHFTCLLFQGLGKVVTYLMVALPISLQVAGYFVILEPFG